MLDVPTSWLIAATALAFAASVLGGAAARRWPMHALAFRVHLLVAALAVQPALVFGGALSAVFPNLGAALPAAVGLASAACGLAAGSGMTATSNSGVIRWAIEREAARQRVASRGGRPDFAPGDDRPLDELVGAAPPAAHGREGITTVFFAAVVLWAALFPWLLAFA